MFSHKMKGEVKYFVNLNMFHVKIFLLEGHGLVDAQYTSMPIWATNSEGLTEALRLALHNYSWGRGNKYALTWVQ